MFDLHHAELFVDSIINHEYANNSHDIPNATDNADIESTTEPLTSVQRERDDKRQTMIPTAHRTSPTNHNDERDDDAEEGGTRYANAFLNGLFNFLEKSIVENHHAVEEPSLQTTILGVSATEETNEKPNISDHLGLAEAQKQIDALREHLDETSGRLSSERCLVRRTLPFSLSSERLVSMEDACRSEQERYRSLTSEYESVRDELVQLTQRSNKENKDYNQLIEDQQSELQHLSSSIVSKRSEHDQLLSIYLCFFLSCYLLIFFLFFCLLSW